MKIKPVIINEKKIYPFSSKESLLESMESKKSILIAMNAEKIINSDNRLKKIINNNTGYVDGFGAEICLKQKGFKAPKIPGCELWLDIIENFQNQKSFYLIGGTQHTIQFTINKLIKNYPKINICGYKNGYFDEVEKKEILFEITSKKPDIIFVAMGTPRQEFLMDEFFDSYKALYVGLGGSFDVFSGKSQRAPNLFIKFNIEWLYRLVSNPSRINRQIRLIYFYFKYLTKRL